MVIGYDDKGLPKTKNVLAKTKSECVEKLKTLKDALAPPAPPRTRADMPFGDWMEHWYETHSRPAARPGTRRIYESYIRLYIKPGIGGIPLNKLTAKDMQQFFTWLKTEGRADQSDDETGLADSQLRNIHSLCRRALEKAVSENLIPQNPASGCKLPPARKGEMNLLSRESMQKLLIQAKEEKYYELFLLEFATGLRLGELTALQWEELNLTTGELRISKQAVVIGSELVITEPKTKAAVRTLLLPPKVLEVFREYRKRNVSRWLFPSPKKEDSPLLPSVVRQRLHRLLDHAGCERVRFHDLRHTFATNALAHGMAVHHPGACLRGHHAEHLLPYHGGDAAAGGGEDRRGHRQSAAAAGRRKRTTRAHDDRLPSKKAMEQTDGITGNSPPRLREILGGAAFRCLWANMWSKGCGAKRNA